MIWIVAGTLAAVALYDRRSRGPLWYFGLSWCLCLAPILFGVIKYGYWPGSDVTYSVRLALLLSFFVVGVLWQRSVPMRSMRAGADAEASVAEFRDDCRIAYACWLAAIAGTLLVAVDFALLGGAGLDDLAALRGEYTGRDQASLYLKLGSVLTWACLYCYIFALLHRQRLRGLAYWLFVIPIAGYFLVALFSAGRQTAFNIALVTVLTFSFRQARTPQATKDTRALGRVRAVVFSIVVAGAMVGYMGYVANARNSGAISESKADVLGMLFDFELDPAFESRLATFGDSIRGGVVEGLVYFSSPAALFSTFLDQNINVHTLGVMSFPFIYRQLQPITGLIVTDALVEKKRLMDDAGVIGAGWTTAISHYIFDFGFLGAGIFLLLQGYYTSFAVRRARMTAEFHATVIAILAIVNLVYMPLIPACSDTTLLLLWGFSGSVIFVRRIRVTHRLRSQPGA